MSAKSHRMQLPREVVVGKNVVDNVTEIIERLGFSQSALVVVGSKTFEMAGKAIVDLLEEAKVRVDTLLVESATVGDVHFVENKIKEVRPEVVFGVGGGTKIDVAKLSSAHRGVPMISVPTSASHDGIASPLSSVKGFEKPYSVMAQAPIAIIADTSVIRRAPWQSTTSGCGDVIAKFTAVRDWKLASEENREYYGDYAASLALMSAKLVVKNAELIGSRDEEGLRVLLEALISCGVSMSIAGSSRPCSGSEHLFSHALDAEGVGNSMHGEQCGVGAIMMAKLQEADWETIRETLEILGAPTSAQELGVKEEEVIRALQMSTSVRPDRYTILSKLKLKPKEYEELARVVCVI